MHLPHNPHNHPRGPLPHLHTSWDLIAVSGFIARFLIQRWHSSWKAIQKNFEIVSFLIWVELGIQQLRVSTQVCCMLGNIAIVSAILESVPLDSIHTSVSCVSLSCFLHHSWVTLASEPALVSSMHCISLVQLCACQEYGSLWSECSGQEVSSISLSDSKGMDDIHWIMNTLTCLPHKC